MMSEERFCQSKQQMSDHKLELEFALAREWMLRCRRYRAPTHLAGLLLALPVALCSDAWHWRGEWMFYKHRESDAFRQYVAEKDKLE